MRQVTTELDLLRAMCDYMAEQLEGRFALQFPNHTEVIEGISGDLRTPLVQGDAETILAVLNVAVSKFGMIVTMCSLEGCDNEENHEFIREFLDLVWDARTLTQEWLKGQGIVPGQSAN